MKRRCLNACTVSISLPKELHEILRKAADDDNRSVSSLVSALVHTHLRSEGYISPGSRWGDDIRPIAMQSRLRFGE